MKPLSSFISESGFSYSDVSNEPGGLAAAAVAAAAALSKTRAIPRLKNVEALARSFGKSETWGMVADSIGRKRQRVYDVPAVCVLVDKNKSYSSPADIVDELRRRTAYYIEKSTRFVFDPGESAVMYDGAAEYSLEEMKEVGGRKERRDKYTFSASEWEWKGGACAPYMSSKRAVYDKDKNLTAVLIPLTAFTTPSTAAAEAFSADLL